MTTTLDAIIDSIHSDKTTDMRLRELVKEVLSDAKEKPLTEILVVGICGPREDDFDYDIRRTKVEMDIERAILTEAAARWAKTMGE